MDQMEKEKTFLKLTSLIKSLLKDVRTKNIQDKSMVIINIFNALTKLLDYKLIENINLDNLKKKVSSLNNNNVNITLEEIKNIIEEIKIRC